MTFVEYEWKRADSQSRRGNSSRVDIGLQWDTLWDNKRSGFDWERHLVFCVCFHRWKRTERS